MCRNTKDKVDNNVLLFPLYGALSLAEQQKTIEPTEKKAIEKSSLPNIAETSLTIEGIRLVLDSAIENEPI